MTDASLTISEFCESEKICRQTFYNLQKAGKGPRIFKIGHLTRISREAHIAWRREREAESVITPSRRSAAA